MFHGTYDYILVHARKRIVSYAVAFGNTLRTNLGSNVVYLGDNQQIAWQIISYSPRFAHLPKTATTTADPIPIQNVMLP